MSRRGEVTISTILLLAALNALVAVVGCITGRFDIAAFMMAVSSLLVSVAVYLEVYSHRG